MLKEAPIPSAVEPATAPDHRAQLFSQDQLEAHAARISATHRLADNPRRGRPLLPTLDERKVKDGQRRDHRNDQRATEPPYSAAAGERRGQALNPAILKIHGHSGDVQFGSYGTR